MLLLKISAILGLYTLACIGIGWFVCYAIFFRSEVLKSVSLGIRTSTNFLLGQAFLSSLWIILGVTQLFSPQIVWGVIVLGAIGGSGYFGLNIASGWEKLCKFGTYFRNETPLWKTNIVFVLLLCCLGFTSVVNSIHGDALAFYLALPKVMASSWRLSLLPGYEVFEGVGLFGELHSAALITLGSVNAARLFGWVTILFGGWVLIELCAWLGCGWRGRYIGFMILFSSSAVLWLAGDGKVDLFSAALGLEAYYWGLRASESSELKFIGLSGLFSGLSMVAKLSYAPVIIPGIGLLIGWRYISSISPLLKHKKITEWMIWLKSIVYTYGIFFISMIMMFIPNMIKNQILYGKIYITSLPQVWFNSVTTQRIVFTYPLALTFGTYWAQYGGLSPLLISFLPLVFFLPRTKPWYENRHIKLLMITLLSLFVWVILEPSILSPRYILATLLCFIPIVARGTEYISENTRFKLVAASTSLAIFITLIFTFSYFRYERFFPVEGIQYLLTGKDTDCSTGGDLCIGANVLNKDAEPGARVLMYSYYRYYLRPDLIQCSMSSSDLIDHTTESQMWHSIYRRGFQYILFDKTTHADMLSKYNHIPDWVEFEQIYSTNVLEIYHLNFLRIPLNERIEVMCEQVHPPAWDLVILDK